MRHATRITWRQVRVGIAVVVALVLLGTAVFFIGETGAIFGERYELVTMMPSANGLIEGASVRLAGQDVGKVRNIGFVPIEARDDPGDVLEISLSINRNVQDQIRADSEARIRTQGLLGDKVIDITPGTPQVPALQEGDTIPSATPIDYEQMLASASGVVDDLAATLGTLRSIARSLMEGQGTAGQLLTDTTLYAELVETSDAMGRFLETVAAGEGALAQLAQDEQLYRDLRSVVAGLDSLTAALVDGDGTLARLLTDETLYRQLSSASARADSLLGAIGEGEGTLGQLMTEQEAYDQLLKLLVDVQTLVQEFRAEPGRYIPPIRVF